MLPVLGAQIASAHSDAVGAGSNDVDMWRGTADNYLDGVMSKKLTKGMH